MVWERLGSASVGGTTPATSWKELARATVSSGTATAITTSTFTPKDNMMIVYTAWGADPRMRVGYNTLDDGDNYNQRYNENYNGSVGTSGSSTRDRWQVNSGGGAHTNGTEGVLGIMQGVNLSTFEKLFYHTSVDNCSGTGTAQHTTQSYQRAMKWINTSNQFNIAGLYTTGNFTVGTEIVVLGFDNDEADSGTNFWQSLKRVEIGSAGDVIDVTGIPAKKYLMFRWYTNPTGGNTDDIYINFNGDTGTNYNYTRQSGNASNEAFGATNKPRIDAGNGVHQRDGFGYIINISGKEKLLFSEDIVQESGDGATNQPRNFEVATKWTGTAQINRITLTNQGSGNMDTNSFVQVWGSD